ncbi:MAG: efflux RND transporter periplasmic adaptor subunit, partial [Chromatocurvus sp.]
MPWLYPIIRYILPLLVAALMLTQLGCSDTGHATAAAPLQDVAVRAATVERLVSDQVLRFAGTVRPRQRASLTFQIGGVLRERRVELGERVTAGQPLALLYHPEITPARDAAAARLRELEANAGQARRDLTRSEELAQRGVISRQALEQQQARLNALDAAAASARASLIQTERMAEEMQLRAPFAGSIEALLVEPGEYVTAGQPVMRLAAADGHEVEVRVPADLLRGLAVDDSVPVNDSFTGTQWQGRVIEAGRSAIDGSVLYPLIVGIDAKDVSAGDAVEVSLQRSGAPGLGIPLAAVMRSADGLAVFRVTGED